MKTELICVNSDVVNKYGFLILPTGMEKSLKEVYKTGMPMLIGHDFHRPIGWNLPLGLFIEPGLTRLLAIKMLAENTKEIEEVRKGVENFLGKKYYERFNEFEPEFLKLIKDCVSSDYDKIDTGCVAVFDAGITKRLFPKLFSEVDGDGLILLDTLLAQFDYAGQGIFKHKTLGLALYAHHFFRRSQSRFNNFHYQFLDALLNLKNKPEVKLRIRLDEDMVGYSPSFHLVGELEFHYGPKYSDDISKIKHGISRHECNPSEKFYYDVSATEFYWKIDNNEMTFELEELKENPSAGDIENFHCRYVHSIFNKGSKEFIHFDGAMRSYDFETMLDRVSKNFIEFGRKAEYKKLFRLDGKIELNTWKLLTTFYLQGNPLVYEYFGVAQERELLRVNNPTSLTITQKLLPYKIFKDDGLKIFLSYHKIADGLKDGRYIDVFDIMSSGSDKIYCLEQMVLEVQKALQRVGEDLEIPDHIILTKCDDEFWNIPSIMHNGSDSIRMLSKTIEAYILLFQKMVDKGVIKNISLTLSFILNGRITRISSFGNIANQISWLKDNFPFAHNEEGITTWVENQTKYLKRFLPWKENCLLESLVQFDGVLYIKRIPINCPFTFEVDDNGLRYNVQFPKDSQVEEFKLLTEGKIAIQLHMSIEKAVWSDTKEDYAQSKRSKWLDDSDAVVELIDCTPLALYWTSI